ncbi:MAG TPA: hypothetical protein VHD81_12290 [Mycobacteriales bacterium]|nr:hypothetical protein [Mycobacteriales bacterium]
MNNRNIWRRTAARLATIAVGVALPVLTVAAPALALHRDDGSGPGGPSLGAGLTIFYFFVIPVGAFLLIAALAVLPSTLKKPRYRPGQPWEHGTNWFGEPAEGESADGATGMAAKDSARGGASAEW